MIKEEMRSPSNLVFLISSYLLIFISICERGGGDYSFERISSILVVWVFFVALTLKWALWCCRIISFSAFPFAFYKFIFYLFFIDNPGHHVDSIVKTFGDIIFALPNTPVAIIGVIISGTVGVSGLLTFFKN